MTGCRKVPEKKRRTSILVPLGLIGIWFVILIDCVIVDAREACWLAGGMMLPLLPVVLIRSGAKPARVLRRTAVVLSAALHAIVIGMIAFLMIFAGTHLADGGESSPIFLLGSDLKDNRPGELYCSRIETARQRLESDPNATLMICGGLTGKNMGTEAEAARSVLTEDGIAPERIVCEDASTRTLDNFNYAAELLEQSGKWDRRQPTAVITNRFHFYRTARLAQTTGYETVRLIPADCKLTIELPWIIREVMTVTKFWFCGPN